MPIMATSFIQMAYSLTDMAWVGRLGSESVAAVGAVGILTWMSGSIALLNKVGAEVSVGQSIGARSEEDARSFASHNITIALLISVCWGGLLFLFARPILNIFELKQHITDAAVTYLRIVSTGLPFVFLSAAFTGIYNAAGRSKIPFYISGTGLIMNILLDPLFIFGFGWGTVGAALATWLSEAMVFGIFVYKLRGKSAVLGGFSFLVRLKKKYTRRIFKLGLPVATLNTLFAFVNMFLSRTASEQGGHIGLMAFTTGGQIEAITWNTSQGFSTGLSTFIAQNYAAGQKSRVKQAWHTTLWMTGVFGSLCSLLFIFFGSEVFSIFVPEAEAYRVGGDFLRIDGYSQMFMMMEIISLSPTISRSSRARCSRHFFSPRSPESSIGKQTLARQFLCISRLKRWKIIVISRRAARSCAGVIVSRRCPFTMTSPSVGRSSILIQRTSVDLPAPLMPMMP